MNHKCAAKDMILGIARANCQSKIFGIWRIFKIVFPKSDLVAVRRLTSDKTRHIYLLKPVSS